MNYAHYFAWLYNFEMHTQSRTPVNLANSSIPLSLPLSLSSSSACLHDVECLLSPALPLSLSRLPLVSLIYLIQPSQLFVCVCVCVRCLTLALSTHKYLLNFKKF